MQAAWVASLRDQCAAAGLPFFFKQWGVRKAEAGRELDGKTHDEMPPRSGSAPVPRRTWHALIGEVGEWSDRKAG